MKPSQWACLLAALTVPGSLGLCKPAPRTVEVLFSQTHEQVLSPFDVSFDGLSVATAELRSLGVAVTQSWQPLSIVLNQSDPCGRVLVLGMAMQRVYQEEDLQAVQRFLSSGGGVLVLAEADNVFMSSDFQNALLEPYGLKVLPSRLTAAAHYNNTEDIAETIETTKEKEWLWFNSSFLEVSFIRLYGAAPIQITQPAFSLLEPLAKLAPVPTPRVAGTGLGGRQLLKKRTAIVAAAAGTSHGDGRMIVLGDQHLLTNMATEHGILEGYNREFFISIVEHLSQRALAPLHAPEPFEELDLHSGDKGQSSVLFATDGGAMSPLPSLTFLANQLALRGHRVWQGSIGAASDAQWAALAPVLVLWVVPVVPGCELTLKRLSGRGPLLVLVGDGYTDPLRTFPYGQLLGRHRGWSQLQRSKMAHYLEDPRITAGYNTTLLWNWQQGKKEEDRKNQPQNPMQEEEELVEDDGRYDIPLNDLSGPKGIWFDALCVLCEPFHGSSCIKPQHYNRVPHLRVNHFVAPATWTGEKEGEISEMITLLRSGTFSVAEDVLVKVLAHTASGTLGATSIAEVAYGTSKSKQYGLLHAGKRFIKAPHRAVVVASAEIFAIADLELITAEEQSNTVDQLGIWLDRKLLVRQRESKRTRASRRSEL